MKKHNGEKLKTRDAFNLSDEKNMLNFFLENTIFSIALAVYDLKIHELVPQTGSISKKDLVDKCKCEESLLWRSLLLLESAGVFHIDKEKEEISHNKGSNDFFTKCRCFLEWSKFQYSHAKECLKTGKSVFELSQGMNAFEYMNKKENSIFTLSAMGAMNIVGRTSGETMKRLKVLESVGEVKKVVDIGGGDGFFLMTVLRELKGVAKGVLFEVPPMIEKLKAQEEIFKKNQVELISGDFFKVETIPSDADLYLLKFIIHDWGEDKAKIILGNICKAIKKGKKKARVMIVESILDQKNNSYQDQLTIDSMMIMHAGKLFGGKERSLDEYRNIINGTGLKIEKVFDDNSQAGFLLLKIDE